MAIEEWTISTVSEQTGTKGMLRFRLDIAGGNTGEVAQLRVDNDGNVIGAPVVTSTTVTATDEPIRDSGLSLMTLNCNWGTSRMLITGVRFRSDTPNRFKGRFSVFGTAEAARAAAAGEERSTSMTLYADGDTGTGNGTQT